MSTNNSGGVRNLRAMFENKVEQSANQPPSRDRSPNGSEFSVNSRPINKIRASFVAVERPGEAGQPPLWGLRKASDETKVNELTAVESIDKEMATERSSLSHHETQEPVDGGLGTILKGSSFEKSPGKPSNNAANLAKAIQSSNLRDKVPKSKPSSDNAKVEAMVKKTQPGERNTKPPPTTKLSIAPGAEVVRPLPTRQMVQSPKSPKVTNQSPKTPTSQPSSPLKSIRGGPKKIIGVMESAKQAQRRDVAKSQDKPKTNGEKKESITSQRTSTGPRSPTLPVKLPPGLTAPTAASAARRESQSSQGLGSEARKSLSKRTSTVGINQPKATTTQTTSSLAKKASRPSLAKPNERPRSRTSLASKPDEGFLARMTRPTASSAQKVHEKVQVASPPKPRNVSGNKMKNPVRKPSRPSLKSSSEVENGDNKENHDQEQVTNNHSKMEVPSVTEERSANGGKDEAHDNMVVHQRQAEVQTTAPASTTML